MNLQDSRQLYRIKAELCKAFADPKRLMLINELRDGEKLVSDLARTLRIPQPVTSHHLAVLRSRGVVVSRRNGTNVYYALSDPRIAEVCEMVHTILLHQMARNKDLAEALIS